ncbi:hypothetical protein Pgin01_01974 [Porphyromonas gingivalis]|jgi:all2200 protein|uniref:TIR domain-containing protein n=1 Tax=Porphyromonas gingivalis TaxID=837 RepID=UPI003095E03F
MYRNSNYTAFYVAEPFEPSSLGAHATKDFCYYNTLRAWKGKDTSFPFNDAHAKTYSVRDGSDWELTLKPRLRERLRASKNIILFLSSNTKSSKALTEEIEYGACTLGLPIIVVYPELDNSQIVSNEQLSSRVKLLWDKLPILKEVMTKVPTLHIPMRQNSMSNALSDSELTIQGKKSGDVTKYFYK